MAKESGLGDRLFVDGYDLSGDVGALQTIGHTVGEQDVTGLNSSARERLQLLHDGELQFSSFYTGTSTSNAHGRFRTAGNLAVVNYLRGTTAEATYRQFGMVAKQVDYKLDRSQSGALLGSVHAKAANGQGPEWGYILDAAASASGTANGSALDLGASHGFTRMALYLHVFTLTATNATVIVQTDDNSGFSSPTTYGSFAAVTAARSAERVAVASAPERYLRWRVTGTSLTAITFAVLVAPTFFA